MNQDLQWAFTLYDKMSAQANAITNALNKLDTSLGKTKKDSKDLQNSFAGFSGPVGNLVGGLKYIANTLMSVSNAILDVGASFGAAALDALAFKETTLVSLTTMMGSADRAKSLFAASMGAGDLTPFSTRDVIGQMQAIMGSGFQEDDAKKVFSALSDVAVVSGGGAAAMQGMLVQIAQAKAIGKFGMQDLKSIMGHAGRAGVGMGDFYDQLAKNTGMSRALVPEMVGKGTINADQGIQALMDVISAKVSHGALGQATLDQAGTLANLMSNIRDLPEKLLFNQDLDSAGVSGVKNFFKSILAVSDQLIGKGKPLTVMFDNLVNRIGGFLGGFDANRLMGMFDELVKGGSVFFDLVKGGLVDGMRMFNVLTGDGSGKAMSFSDAMAMAGRGAAVLIEAIAVLAGLLVKAYQGWDMLITGISNVSWADVVEGFKMSIMVWVDLGRSLVQGLLEGMKSEFPTVYGLLDAASFGLVTTVRKALKIESPSKVFAELGAQTAAGFAMGVEGGVPGVSAALGGMAQPKAVAVAGGRQAMNMPPVELHVHVDGRGDDAEALATKLKELLPAELDKLFYRLALESGEV